MTNVVELHDIRKTYGRVTVMDVPQLAIPFGARLQVTGANGSGKSTFLRLVAGITLPTSGRVIWHLPRGERRVAFVPQSGGYLGELTVAENAQALCATLGKWARSILDDQQVLADFALGSALNVPMVRLSEGTRRLFVILASIVAGPNVLIADEPYAGIDAENQYRLQGLLAERLDRDAMYMASTHQTDSHSQTLRIANAHVES